MTLDQMQVAVAPGDGLVARFGEVVLVAGDVGQSAVLEEVLATCRSLGSSGMSAPGPVLAEHLESLVRRAGGADGPSFCVLAAGDDALHVVLRGDLDLVVARDDHLSRHTGAEPDTWVDVVIDGEFDRLTIGPAGDRPAADPRVDLSGGVVLGGGILVFPRPEKTDEPAEAERAPSPRPGPPPASALPGSWAPPTHPPLPAAARPCSRGHVNPPGALYCSSCGVPVTATVAPSPASPPRPLGLLVLDDGSAYALDHDYVIGREPFESGSVQSGRARPLVLEDPDISRVHAEVRARGGHVEVVDRDSVGGTYVAAPGSTEWTRLTAGAPYSLQPGAHVLLGRRWFGYQAFMPPG